MVEIDDMMSLKKPTVFSVSPALLSGSGSLASHFAGRTSVVFLDHLGIPLHSLQRSVFDDPEGLMV